MPDEPVVRAAATCLLACASPDLSPIENLATADASPLVRRVALAALRRLRALPLDRSRGERALEQSSQALDRAPTDPALWHEAARALAQLHLPEAAVAALDRALALDPEREPAHFDRGTLLVALGRPAEALEAFARCASLTDPRAEAADSHCTPGS